MTPLTPQEQAVLEAIERRLSQDDRRLAARLTGPGHRPGGRFTPGSRLPSALVMTGVPLTLSGWWLGVGSATWGGIACLAVAAGSRPRTRARLRQIARTVQQALRDDDV